MVTGRRGFLGALGALVALPHVTSPVPVPKALPEASSKPQQGFFPITMNGTKYFVPIFAACFLLACRGEAPQPPPVPGDACEQAAANEERLACPEWARANVDRAAWAARCRKIEAGGLLHVCPICIARASSCDATEKCRPPSCGE